MAAAVQGTTVTGLFEVLCTRSNSDRGHLYEPSVINAVRLVECVEADQSGPSLGSQPCPDRRHRLVQTTSDGSAVDFGI